MDWKFWQWKRSALDSSKKYLAVLNVLNEERTDHKRTASALQHAISQAGADRDRRTVTIAFSGKFTPARRNELVASLYGGEAWEALMELLDAEFVAEMNGDALLPHVDEKRALYAAERAGAILALKAEIKNAVAEARSNAAAKEKK